MKFKHVFLAVLLLSEMSFAGECILSINRKACPGKEKQAYAPYDGKETTEEKKKASSAEDCAELANKESKIKRKGTLSEKTVNAKYDGKDLAPANSKNSCD